MTAPTTPDWWALANADEIAARLALCDPQLGGLPAGTPGSAPYVRIVYPPWLIKLPSSKDFNVQDYTMVLPAVAGASITSPALRFQLPADQVGWLQVMGEYVLTPTALTQVRWTARINGSPVPGWNDIQNPPGVANFLFFDDADMQIRLGDGVVVDMVITNLNGAGPWVVGGQLRGWYHPLVAERIAWGIA